MRRLLLLLFLSCAVLAFNTSTSKPSTSTKLKNTVTIIKENSVSFRRYGMTYYHTGHFKLTRSNPKKCAIFQNHTDWPFGKQQFPNGTLLAGVEFGCQSDDICRKYRCDRSIATGLVWCAFLLISSIISVGIIIRYVVGRRTEEDPPVQDMEMRSAYIPVVVVSNGHLDVPVTYPDN